MSKKITHRNRHAGPARFVPTSYIRAKVVPSTIEDSSDYEPTHGVVAAAMRAVSATQHDYRVPPAWNLNPGS